MKSYLEQLLEVQTAISIIEGGAQSYTIGNRQLTRADLNTLYSREKWLRAMVAREELNDGYIRCQRGVPEE